MAIAEQMGVRPENTAHSVNIKERLDFSCALFDPEGNLIANAPYIPVHLGSMGGPSLIDVMPWWVHPDVDGHRRHLYAVEQLRRHRRRHRAVEDRPRFGIARSVAAASRHLGEHQNPERHPRPSGCSAGCPVPWAGSPSVGQGVRRCGHVARSAPEAARGGPWHVRSTNSARHSAPPTPAPPSPCATAPNPTGDRTSIPAACQESWGTRVRTVSSAATRDHRRW